MGEPPKVYTLADVSEHAESNDCWLIISGKVYDVTIFLDEHPGGQEVLIQAAGIDATDDFEEVGHSSEAKAMMDKYYIGEIGSSTLPERKIHEPPIQVVEMSDKNPGFLSKMWQFLVPFAILGLAILAYYMHTEGKH